jgi:hypothetical protein
MMIAQEEMRREGFKAKAIKKFNEKGVEEGMIIMMRCFG